MKVRFGSHSLDFPGPELGELRDSGELLGDVAALRERLADDGYLLVRGLLDRDEVLRARTRVLEHMEANDALTPGTPLLEGVMPPGGRGVPMMGRRAITHSPELLTVLESPRLFALFEALFAEPAAPFDYKWLRAIGNEAYTGAHMDIVYMGRGSSRVHTCWIPFGDFGVERGTLAVCRGSQRLEGFARIRETYGRLDVDRDRAGGWFSQEPLEISETFGGRWLTSGFRMGDVVIFGMQLMHASTTNLGDRFRLSCDVRFQPAADPMDERWRRQGRGHNPEGPTRQIEDFRKDWKF